LAAPKQFEGDSTRHGRCNATTADDETLATGGEIGDDIGGTAEGAFEEDNVLSVGDAAMRRGDESDEGGAARMLVTRNDSAASAGVSVADG